MKKILIYIFCIAVISLTGCSNTVSEKAADINVMDYTDSFEYEGKAFLYSKVHSIQNKDYTYFVLDEHKKEIAITKIQNAKEELAIPAKLDGYKVVCLSVPFHNFAAYEEGEYMPESQYCILNQADANNVKSLIIPEGVEIIGIAAFMDLSQLKRVSLPDSLKVIGVDAFANDGIEKIELPINLENVEMSAFYNCESLTKVTINSREAFFETEYPPFKSCGRLEEVVLGNVECAYMDGFRLNNIKRMIVHSSAKTIDMTNCNIGTIILEGRNTVFNWREDYHYDWNEDLTVVVPEGSEAIPVLEKLNIKFIKK
jgi:predicted small secreted protein